MTLRTLPLFGTGFPAQSRSVTNQKRTNLYVVPEREPDKSGFHLACTPGLSLFAEVSTYPSRGAISVNGYIYTVNESKLYSINPSGGVTTLGTINSATAPVVFAWNGTVLVFVDGYQGWTFTPATSTLARITDADFPATPGSVAFLAGRFVVNTNGAGQFYWSGLLTGTAWDPLDFATAESETDNLVAIASDHGSLVLLGDLTTEFWAPNPGSTSSADAFVRVGGSGIEWGIAAARTIAKFDTGLIWLAKNQLGEARVVKLQGYTPVPLDDPEVSHAINAQTGLEDATGFSYVQDGRTFYQLNVGEISLLFDGIGWSYVSSGSSGGRHRANVRASLSERPYVFDYESGACYLLDKTNLTDSEATIVREVVTKHLLADFNPLTVWKLIVDCEVGHTAEATAPQMMMQYSKDGGNTWSSELWSDMGAVGEYTKRVIWRTLGRARDFTFRFRVSDKVGVTITAIAAQVEA